MSLLRQGHVLAIITFFYMIISDANAQLQLINAEVYFFHPTLPRYNSGIGTHLRIIDSNTYQLEVGDLGISSGYSFQFQVDANYKLVNWVAIGSTPAAPASGFMTLDNPGKIAYPISPLPGQWPFNSTLYNNTYDPLTHTFYLHYGYGTGSSSQAGYTRQIYEKCTVNQKNTATISSFTPKKGGFGTPITIHGSGFSSMKADGFNLNKFVYFGKFNQNSSENAFHFPADSVVVLSDSVLIAYLGRATSGNVYVTNTRQLGGDLNDSLSGFIFIPVTSVSNFGWNYIGNASFSNPSTFGGNVPIACGTDNSLYLAYIDSISNLIKVMKYEGSNWVNVGTQNEIGKVDPDNIQNFILLLDTGNNPIVAYNDFDSNATCLVKTFKGGIWKTLASRTTLHPGSFALDNNNILYNFDGINIYKFQNGSWEKVGNTNFGVTSSENRQFNITIDKTTNLPYIIVSVSDSPRIAFKTKILKFDGTNWVVVGQPIVLENFGTYYLDISIDNNGVPIVSFQDDNSFERASVYKYINGSWTPVGYPRFTNSHSHNLSFALNKRNTPYILFFDESYNGAGTVMSYSDTGSWKCVGARGFIPTNYFCRTSLVIDTAANPIIAFADNAHGGKISVMKFGNTSLPISILSLGVYTRENKIEINWKTVNEQNTSDFIIESSKDVTHFKPIGTLKAIGSGANGYQFTDNNPTDGINYYRLKSVDKDGAVSYSKVVSVQLTVNSNQLTVFPNPAKSSVIIKGNHIVSVQLVDNLGRVIKTQTLKDATNPALSVGGLPVGVYHLRVQTTDGKVSGVGFVKE